MLPSAESREQAIKVAERIGETLNMPFEIDDHQVDIECKIGISIFPIHGVDEKVLIRRADKAIQHAKSNKLAVYVFEPE